jgi:hypothetical protein
MADRIEKLRSTVQELEAELAALQTLDDETRSVLESVLVEIGEVLKKQSSADGPRHASIAAKLQDAAGEFESSHPTLFGIVSRAIDALGQMGI